MVVLKVAQRAETTAGLKVALRVEWKENLKVDSTGIALVGWKVVSMDVS